MGNERIILKNEVDKMNIDYKLNFIRKVRSELRLPEDEKIEKEIASKIDYEEIEMYKRYINTYMDCRAYIFINSLLMKKLK